MHSQNFPSTESEQDFGKTIAAGCDQGPPELVTLVVYPTEKDYHQLRPDLCDVPHESYIRSVAGGVIAAQQRGYPVLLKELRAAPYLAWLDQHGLEQNRPHCFLYTCFAPLLEDPALLSQLGVIPVNPTDLYPPPGLMPAPRHAWADQVEKAAVQVAVVHRCNHPLSVLTLVYAMAATGGRQMAAPAWWALADRLATGMPYRALTTALVDSQDLAATWRKADRQRWEHALPITALRPKIVPARKTSGIQGYPGVL